MSTLHRELGIAYKDMATLYRTNAQSRAIEQALADRGIAYRVLGGTRFYDRREVRDILAWLQLIANRYDEVALRRVINVPRRGIGPTSMAKLLAFAVERNVALIGRSGSR